MGTVAMRTYAREEDPWGVKNSLEQFLKEKNIKALMAVLTDDRNISHDGLTKSIALSYHVKGDPKIQKELSDALIGLDFTGLADERDVREILAFMHDSLTSRDDKQGEEVFAVYKKRVTKFYDGAFSHLPPNAQGDIILNISGSLRCFSEEEVAQMLSLKEQSEKYWVALIYQYNPQRAIDFIAAKGDGQKLLSFAVIHGLSDEIGGLASMQYISEKYASLLGENRLKRLHKWIAHVQA